MVMLIVDVAAEHGGALTILEQYKSEFEGDNGNSYIFLVSKPKYPNTFNVLFLNFEWVKNSFIHRLYFDYIYMRKIIKVYKPDKILSLQNNAVYSGNIPQDVYFHNALFICEKRYSLFKSKTIWMYQNIISFIVRNSLRHAKNIYVQAEWIKKSLNVKWKIDKDKIIVKRPYCNFKADTIANRKRSASIFYPSNFQLYKNFDILFNACVSIWNKKGKDCGLVLHLLGEEKSFSNAFGKIIDSYDYPIFFHGRLTRQEMFEMYKSNSLVFPSFVETVGLPLVECASVGGYIMVSDLEYAHEALNGYSNCDYFNPYNELELIELINEVINKKDNE